MIALWCPPRIPSVHRFGLLSFHCFVGLCRFVQNGLHQVREPRAPASGKSSYTLALCQTRSLAVAARNLARNYLSARGLC